MGQPYQEQGDYFSNNEIDITGVTYVSDGKFLNASLWLDGKPNSSNSYLMGIDADQDSNTGWAGMDYQIIIYWDPEIGWKREIREVTGFHWNLSGRPLESTKLNIS